MLLPVVFPVTCHTDHVGKGSVFVAIKGFTYDGTTFIDQALEKGASVIIVQDDCHHDSFQVMCHQFGAQYLRVPNVRQALAEYAAESLGHPAHKLKVIGVTGTKGKTSTVFLTEHILRVSGYKTALMSSVKNQMLDDSEPSKRATQQSDYIQMFLAECVKRGVEYVVIEVSSHALALDRVYGIQFDVVGFNNLHTDHLDFHHTMDDYFATKMMLLNMLKPEGAVVINTDNAWGKKAYNYLKQHEQRDRLVYTFGTQDFENPRHIAMDIDCATSGGIEMVMQMRPGLMLESPHLFGTFNCYNIAMATIICASLGVSYSALARAITSFKGVPGRLQRHVLNNGALAFVDYAHMPLAMHEVLQTLRPFTPHLIVVFGCGGDRDPSRRPAMGKIAAELADVVIVTDDNPRFEEPSSIARDIIAGISGEQLHKVSTILNRADAIAHAAKIANENSIIALLGKGHEDYYIVKDQVLHFNDCEEISRY